MSDTTSIGWGAALPRWLKAARPHQWAKNILLFVPLLLSGRFLDQHALLQTCAGLIVLCLGASAVYIINDVLDREHDRAHPTKQHRPFASGQLSATAGLIVGVLGLAVAVVLSFALDAAFGWVLVSYVALTSFYSLLLKRVPIWDVAALAVLYGLRLAMGAALAEVRLSSWLTIFALFFFLSLSLAKRHAEIMEQPPGDGWVRGRGYRTIDARFTLPLGLAAGMTALLVMVLFLVFEAFVGPGYAHPTFLWATPLVTFIWLSRVWLLASRAELDEDPVLFAFRDRQSLALGFALLTLAVLAVAPW